MQGQKEYERELFYLLFEVLMGLAVKIGIMVEM